jgi:hypothetical protein
MGWEGGRQISIVSLRIRPSASLDQMATFATILLFLLIKPTPAFAGADSSNVEVLPSVKYAKIPLTYSCLFHIFNPLPNELSLLNRARRKASGGK